MWWSVPVRLAAGETYYRDVPLQYGPLSPYLLALGIRLFGFSISWVLLSNWIPAVLAGLLLLELGRGHLSEVERFGAAGLALGLGLFAPGPGRLVYSYNPPAVHALCFALAALLVSRRESYPRLLWAGVLAGAAFAAKQEIGVAALAAIACGILVRGERRGRRLAAATAGFGAIALAAFGFALRAASLESLRRDSHLWPLAPLPSSWSALYGVVSDIRSPHLAARIVESLLVLLFYAAAIAWGAVFLAKDDRRRLVVPVVLIGLAAVGSAFAGYWLPLRWSPLVLSMLVAAATAALAVAGRVEAFESLVAIGVFSALLAARTGFAWDAGAPYGGVARFGTALCWPLLVCALLPRWLPGGQSAARRARQFAGWVLLPVAWLAAARGATRLGNEGRVPLDTRIGRVWLTPPNADLYRAMASRIRPGDRILALPEISAVDVVFGAHTASPYPHLLPGVLDDAVEAALVRDLERRPPEAIVVFERPTAEYGVEPLGAGFGRKLMSWIDENYGVAEQAAAGRILLRRGGLPGRYNPLP